MIAALEQSSRFTLAEYLTWEEQLELQKPEHTDSSLTTTRLTS